MSEVIIQKSKSKGKKYDAVITNKEGKKKTVSFGATGYEHFTDGHKDETRKSNLYIKTRRRKSELERPFNACILE